MARAAALRGLAMIGLSFGSALGTADTRVEEATCETRLVPSPARYTVLLPPSYASGEQRYPLLLWLHGGNGDNGFLKAQVPLFESVWGAGAVPEMIVVTPDADRSFYLDWRDGSQRWETFILDELVPRLERAYRTDPKARLVAGVSMGGMGALRMAFKRPEQFRAVVAFEPGIEPALAWKDVELRDRFYREAGLLEARFGTKDGGIDEAYWAANNPATLVDRDARRLVEAGLAIYLDVGSEDLFGLDRGADFLHETLYRHGVKHEYRYVLGADHVGNSLGPRFRDGLAFIGRILAPPVPDPQLQRTRQMIDFMKRRAGLPSSE